MFSDFEKRKKEIEEYFDSQKQQELSRLQQEAASQSQKQKAEAELLDKKYAAEGNNLAVQYERNRRNFNIQAAARGLNSGTASQAELAHNAMYLKEFGAHSAARSAARERGVQALRELTASFNAKAAEAAAGYDRDKAKEIFSQREKYLQQQLSQASTLAKYGDFSLYAKIYGPEQARNMENVWLKQNPNLAYSMGKISASEYYAITGRYAPGTAPARSGGRSGGGGSSGSKKKKPQKTVYPLPVPVNPAHTRPGNGHRIDLIN